MNMGYVLVILAMLQVAIVFLPITKNVRYKNFLSLFIQIVFLIGIGFYMASNSSPTAIYLTIPCFLLIFLLPRFGKLFSHLSAT